MNDEKLKLQFLEEIFDEIAEKLTPDFSKDDWMNLFEKARQGDPTSGEMFMRLWQRKVEPHIHPEWKKFLKIE